MSRSDRFGKINQQWKINHIIEQVEAYFRKERKRLIICILFVFILRKTWKKAIATEL